MICSNCKGEIYAPLLKGSGVAQGWLHKGADRADSICRQLLRDRGGVFTPNVLYCLGKTNTGAPKHPVRLPYSTQLEVYR